MDGAAEAPVWGRGARALLVTASAVVVVAGLKAASGLLAPLALALFLAFLSFPLVFWLQRKGWPSVAATAATLVVNLAVVCLVVMLAVASVGDFEQKIPVYKERSTQLYGATVDWLEARGLRVREHLAPDMVKPGAIFDLTRRGLTRVMDVVSHGALVLLVMIFALLEAAAIPAKLQVIFGRTDGDPERFHKIVREILQYLWIKTLVSVATGVMVGLGAWIIGVDFPVLWGLLAFALNYIPTIGSILAAVPAVLLALVQLGWGPAAAFLAVIVAANVILGNIVEPMFMGRRLGLSTLVVTLALVFWGWLWGPIGMLLSVPLTMVMKIVVQNIPDLAWVAVVLSDWSDEAPPKPAPAAEAEAGEVAAAPAEPPASDAEESGRG